MDTKYLDHHKYDYYNVASPTLSNDSVKAVQRLNNLQQFIGNIRDSRDKKDAINSAS